MPNRSPNAPDCVVATSGRKARGAQRIGDPDIGAYAIETCSAAPPECAVGPGRYHGLSALRISGPNSHDRARGIGSGRRLRDLLLIKRKPEINIGIHPRPSNCPQDYAVDNGRLVYLSEYSEVVYRSRMIIPA